MDYRVSLRMTLAVATISSIVCSVELHASAEEVMPGAVLSDETATPSEDGAVSADEKAAAEDAARHRIDRTWLYLDDARVAAPLVVVGISNISYTNAGSSPSRIDSPYPNSYNAFAANMASVGAELGLLPYVSVIALGQVGLGGLGPSPNAGLIAGMRAQLTPLSWQFLHVVASGGYLREAWQGPVYDDDSHKWRLDRVIAVVSLSCVP